MSATPIAPKGSTDLVRLGSRGSPLALWQTRAIADALQLHHPGLQTEIVIIRTEGDRNRQDPLSVIGGRGVFVREIEKALICGDIDIAVHSMKDMPTEQPPELHFPVVPARGEVRDVYVGRDGQPFTGRRDSPSIGTGSLRRRAQLLAVNERVELREVRGNVDTRLRKMREGEVDGLVLAAAGLIRLGREAEITEYLPMDVMLPAVGQAALGVQTRRGAAAEALLAPLHDAATGWAVTAERAFLAHLSGGCMVPIAAFGECRGERLSLQGLVCSPGGEQVLRHGAEGPCEQAVSLGQELAEVLLASGAGDILRAQRDGA
ncbi:hydroxymethylbilane synthase [Candidatus Entotheonella palauensis]|uniref:hydroxymethylbilane synthase n=1 Tax=Candidatus Entotheonella palauensis TaxID=93172 RepID=UPI000B7C6CCF|nr:hydroxymethylbilane synthase [Candidatus Entotheonella palauensis]